MCDKNLKVNHLCAEHANIDCYKLKKGCIKEAKIKNADIDELNANQGTFYNLYSSNAYFTNFTYTNLHLNSLTIDNLSVTNLSANNISTTNLTTTNLSAQFISVTNLSANNISTTNLTTTNLLAQFISVTNLSANNISTTNLCATSIYGNVYGSYMTNRYITISTTTYTIDTSNPATFANFYLISGISGSGNYNCTITIGQMSQVYDGLTLNIFNLNKNTCNLHLSTTTPDKIYDSNFNQSIAHQFSVNGMHNLTLFCSYNSASNFMRIYNMSYIS